MNANTDSLQRFLFEGAPVRGEIVHLDATWRAVLERHAIPRRCALCWVELMAAAALLSATIKFTGSLIMQVQGSGPVKLIVVECTSEQTMRATAKWEGELPNAALSASWSATAASSSRSPRRMPSRPIRASSRSKAIAWPRCWSTTWQPPSSWRRVCGLRADDEQAAGMLLQRLPGASGQRSRCLEPRG